MNDERTYIVAYDIADARRWRRVFKTMNGFGEWLQLSVFQCRLSRRRRAELETRLPPSPPPFPSPPSSPAGAELCRPLPHV